MVPVFLNNLTGSWITPNGPRFDRKTNSHYRCTLQDPCRPRHRIRVKISPHWEEIKVRIARSWLMQPMLADGQARIAEGRADAEEDALLTETNVHGPWTAIQIEKLMTQGGRRRPLKSARLRKFWQYHGRILMRHTSHCICEKKSQMVHDKSEFGKPLRYVIKAIRRLGEDFLPEDCDLFEAIADAIQSESYYKADGQSQAAFESQLGRQGRITG